MFILIFEQLLKMFFIMLLAFICYKIKLVDQNGNRSISNLLLMVVNPLLIITVYQDTEYDPDMVRGLLLAFAAAFITHILGVLISTVLIRPSSGPDCSIERFNSMYSNCGIIGIPLVNSILGCSGVFFITAYMVVFNLFTWTHGIILMEKKCSLKNMKEGILSPMFLSTLAAVALFFLRIRIPSVVLDSMNYVADMNTPLAMMVAGFSVAQSDLGKMLRNLRIYFISFIKLILIPVLMIAVLKLMSLPSEVATTILIGAACPAATTGTMMAIRYRQNYTYSSELFATTTVLSIITIPAVVFLAEIIL